MTGQIAIEGSGLLWSGLTSFAEHAQLLVVVVVVVGAWGKPPHWGKLGGWGSPLLTSCWAWLGGEGRGIVGAAVAIMSLLLLVVHHAPQRLLQDAVRRVELTSVWQGVRVREFHPVR